MNLADAQPGVFKMNLDAHLVCHLATTETWVHDKGPFNYYVRLFWDFFQPSSNSTTVEDGQK